MAPPHTTQTASTNPRPAALLETTISGPLTALSIPEVLGSTITISTSSTTSTPPPSSQQPNEATLAPLTTSTPTTIVATVTGNSFPGAVTIVPFLSATIGAAPSASTTSSAVLATKTPSSSSSPSSHGLSRGDIAAAVLLPLLALLALLAFCLVRRRRRRRNHPRYNADTKESHPRGSTSSRTGDDMTALPSELAWIRTLLERTRLSSPRSLTSQRAELPGMRTPRSIYSRAELPVARTPRSVRSRAELPGWRTPRDRERDSHGNREREREKVPPVPSIVHLAELEGEEVRRGVIYEKGEP